MKDTKPSIVFCHGIWADGSCFAKVIPALQAEGHQCIAAQYSLNTTADKMLAFLRHAYRQEQLVSPALWLHSPSRARSTPCWVGWVIR
ncbi:MAG TPA: hypothetical protein VF772_04170, partial [Terriglobales bacterium]